MQIDFLKIMAKVNKKPSASAVKRAKHAKATKEMEAVLQMGESGSITTEDNGSVVGDELMSPIDEATPDTQATEDKEEYGKLRKEVKSLKRKFKLAFATADYVCPSEIVSVAERIESRNKNFTTYVEITVAEAQSVQDTHKEVLALSYGEHAVAVFKLFRRSLSQEFPHVSREERSCKVIPQGSPILEEFRATSYLISELLNERCSPGWFRLSFRAGMRIVVDRLHANVFTTLLGVITRPYSEVNTKAEMQLLLEDIKNDIVTLFGETNTTAVNTAKLLANWSSVEVTRQVVFAATRKIFPAKRECHPRVYAATNLEKLDDALKNGVDDWAVEAKRAPAADALESPRVEESGSPPPKTSGLNFSRMEKLYNSIKRKRLDMDL